jgi:hypothetical protein
VVICNKEDLLQITAMNFATVGQADLTLKMEKPRK